MAANLNPVQQVAHDSSRAHLLSYDIHPEAVGKHTRYDPSPKLWTLGARLTESVWVIPDRNVVRLPLAEWAEAYGMEADLVRFDERDAEAIKRLARRGIEREANRVRESIEKTRTDLAAKVAVATDRTAKTKMRGCAMNALWRARKALESLTECAVMFDLMGDVTLLLDAAKQVVRVNDGLFYAWFKEADDPSVATVEQLDILGAAPDGASTQEGLCVTA